MITTSPAGIVARIAIRKTTAVRRAASRGVARTASGPEHHPESLRKVEERLAPGDRDAVQAELARACDCAEQPLVEAVVPGFHHSPGVSLDPEADRLGGQPEVRLPEARQPRARVPDEDERREHLTDDPGDDRRLDGDQAERGEEPVDGDVQRRADERGCVRGCEPVVRPNEELKVEEEDQHRNRREREPSKGWIGVPGDARKDSHQDGQDGDRNQAEGEGQEGGVPAERAPPVRLSAGDVGRCLFDPERRERRGQHRDRRQEDELTTPRWP